MNPGNTIWHVACDESGIDGQRFYGFGSLWMRYQRRGDFSRMIKELREKHNFHEEIKWQKANSKRYFNFYNDLITMFFKHAWFAFHCIIVEKSIVNKEFHNGDYDLAMRKHFTSLIISKASTIIKAHPDRECFFRVEVDPLPSRYKKADEAFHVIANNTLARRFGRKGVIKSVVVKDSKHSENIQISDFLLGAVMSSFQGKVASESKIQLSNNIAEHLGWDSLRYDTMPAERKFNVWFFYDRTRGPREIVTNPVELKYPLPPR